MYKGITFLGTHKFSSLYGLNETIIDQKAIGLQHLYINNFEEDYIYAAGNAVTHHNVAYNGDRIKPKIGRPYRKASKSAVIDSVFYQDVFDYEKFTKIDIVGVYDHVIYFENHINNLSNLKETFKIGSLITTSPKLIKKVIKYGTYFLIEYDRVWLGIRQDMVDDFYVAKDAPSGFMFRGIENLLYEKKTNDFVELESLLPISLSMMKSIEIEPQKKALVKWVICFSSDKENIIKTLDQIDFNNQRQLVKNYWHKTNKNIKKQSAVEINALKGALLNGFMPSDLTGHYFAKEHVTMYTRDALMSSRAFLYHGLYKEFESIIQYISKRPLKENGEFYQRYNAQGEPDEGANNQVFSQIDAIGYFASVVTDYYVLTKKLVVEFSYIKKIIEVLYHVKKYKGIYGPEGGVNEGVYGPAYIVSTNMFIAAGLRNAAYLAYNLDQQNIATKWLSMANDLEKSINQCFLEEEEYFAYGYVSYDQEIVKRIDTPQLLAASLGYPINKYVKSNFKTLLKKGTYFQFGFGYSEQEYHHGPWIFNTAGAAMTAYLIDEKISYKNILNWIDEHHNQYGIYPEAIDGVNEQHIYINPLMWATAEVSALRRINKIKEIRGIINDCLQQIVD